MNNIDEGYIKFNLSWDEKDFDFNYNDFLQINSHRNKLYELELIGAYPDGIGFGNISLRNNKSEFIISGSATGNFNNIHKNSVLCEGLNKASSESLTHVAIYESNMEVNAVIHIHNETMWSKYLNDLPTTDKRAEFGTPEIAMEIKKLANHNSGIIIMGGHQEGIIAYGKSLFEAEEIILNYYNKL